MSYAEWSSKKKKKEYSSYTEWSNAKHGISEEEKDSSLAWRNDEDDIAPTNRNPYTDYDTFPLKNTTATQRRGDLYASTLDSGSTPMLKVIKEYNGDIGAAYEGTVSTYQNAISEYEKVKKKYDGMVKSDGTYTRMGGLSTKKADQEKQKAFLPTLQAAEKKMKDAEYWYNGILPIYEKAVADYQEQLRNSIPGTTIEEKKAYLEKQLKAGHIITPGQNLGKIAFGKVTDVPTYITDKDFQQNMLIDRELAKETGEDTWFSEGAFKDGYDGAEDIAKSAGATVGDAGLSVLEGIGHMGEGLVDLATYGVAGLVDLFGGDEAAKDIKAFAKQNHIEDAFGNTRRELGIYNNSLLGNKSRGAGEGIGQIGGIVLTGGFGSAAGLTSLGTTILTSGTMGLSSMGSGMSEAYQGGATDGEALAYGATVGAIDTVSELIFGGLGKGFNALGFSKGLTSIDDVLAKKISNTAARFITSDVGQKFVGNTLEWAVKSGAEGVEEVIAGFGSAVAKDLFLLNDEDEQAFWDIVEDENLLEQFVVGSIASGIAQSGYIPGMKNGSLREANKTGRDFISGLSKNEQTVVDKIYEQRLAEESKNKTLSNKDKNKLYDRVVEEMKKGYITTDKIESILGGETYKGYKDLTDKKNSLEERKKAIEEEIKSLVKTPESQFTVEQREKLTSLREEAKGIKDELQNLGIRTAKNNLFNEVNKLTAKDTYLRESYNEIARRGQAFTADTTKYTGKQREAIQRAIDSGVLNNTNRSHELVDTLSKIEADKGIVFDYTNNAKLKESGFAVEGKTVNGFVKDGTITLNVQSSKAWQSTVGHEIAHVLEGTESYGALQSALFKYAESKGEYQNRYDTLAELYNGVKGYETDFEAKIKKELTADLVGDYLFTDKNFINHLMGDRTLFQKVYDEIKYLCKIATGKELTEIEKVKREFDRAWKEMGQFTQAGELDTEFDNDDVNYSISADSNGNELSLAVQKRFANSKAVDENGKLKVLYHGTANGEFYTFDKAKGSVEGDFGSGFYFTDNESDVERNYEGGGADFENKVARRAEQIEAEEDIEYSEAERRAREELYVGSNKFEVYLNIENPAIVGETNLFDYESFAEEYDRNDYDSDEDYEGDVEQLIADTIDEIIWDIDRNVDIYSTDGIANVLWEAVNEGGIDIEQLKANINNLYLEDSNGNLVGNEVTRQIIESLGYDGIIDNTVSSKFNMGLSEGTTHYIVFKPNQIKDISNQNPTDNPDIRYSLSKDIENFDNSWYNEIELPDAERDRVVSEALTWNADKRNQLITQTLSNDITYRYMIDDDGNIHFYGREIAVNIHERKKEYDNTNGERPDSVIEEFRLRQGNDSERVDIGENGRNQGEDDTNDNYFVSGEGRSNRTGYSKNRTNAYRKPKAIGWHLNDDGSVEVTYSDGTKEIEYPTPKKRASSKSGVFFDGKNSKHSLSYEGEQFTPTGNYSTPLSETALEQDIAPVAEGVAKNATTTTDAPMPSNSTPKSAQIANGTRGDNLLVESLDNYPMETVEQKVAENIRAIEGELADNRDIRREAEDNYNRQIAKLQKEYNSKKNKESKVAYGLLQSISRLERLKASTDAKFAKRISDLEARLEKMKDPQYSRAMYKKAKMEEHAKFAEDLIGDTSTWVDKKLGLQYAVNTERRNLRDIVRDENGNVDIERADAINDALNGQYNRNQAERNRKDNEISKKYRDLKVNRHESVYANMLGELRHNPETTLTEKDVNEYYEEHKNKIDTKKVDKFIDYVRSDLDYFFESLNTKLREQGMKEIPYRKGYFPHKVEPKQNFIQKLLNWKTQDTEIPTSIAGLTEDFKPVKSYQSFDKQRHSDETDYDLMRLFQNYKNGALDWIYHLEDIQKRRAVENYIRYTHSEEGVQARIKEVYANEDFDADEAQAEIEKILTEAKNPLNNFVQDFTTHTNILAGKKNSLDRTAEQMTNRKIYSIMQNVQNRTSANMVLANVRSALTNFIPITQSWAQVSPLRSLQATKDTIANSIKDDGLINKSTFLTNRLREADSLYKTNWDKVLDKAGIMFEIVDNFSSQVIWRSKYNQNLSNGMSEAEAIANADQFAENVMAGRSKGNEPTLFNAKNPLVKAFTMFQLEVNNQYGYLFKDVPNDLKAETNHWKLNLAKGYTTAFIGAYIYNELLTKVTGSDAALDPIGIIEDLLRDLGLFDDDEEKEPDEVITNLVDNVVEELPFVGGLFGGGRIPISSAIPYGGEYGGGLSAAIKDVTEGNWENIGKEMMNPILNVGLPVGGGQLKKTVQGLNMFSDEHPVTGSYTDSGSLRFPVEDTFGNRVQAALFGQYASKNAREYFDNDYAPLKEKQIQEYQDVDLPIADYWKYREGLSGLKTNAEKANYINSLDIENWQKNLLLNNILDRKEDVDMSNYDDYSDWEEFDYAQKNPDKYAFAKSVGGYSAYRTYLGELYDIKADKDEYGKSISGSRKEKVINYINNLDADYETKIILFKSEYPSDDTYNMEIINYINNRTDLTYEERVAIFTELGFTVSDGSVYWD